MSKNVVMYSGICINSFTIKTELYETISLKEDGILNLENSLKERLSPLSYYVYNNICVWYIYVYTGQCCKLEYKYVHIIPQKLLGILLGVAMK